MRITVPDGRPSVGIDAAKLHDPDWYADGDPHPVWKAMRDIAPVYRHTLPDGLQYWSVTRLGDVSSVLRDHRRFTSRRGTLLSILGGTDPAADKMMAASDPPVHTAMREPLMRVMSHGALRSRVPSIRQMVRSMIAPVLAGGSWDVAEAAVGFPMAFSGALMGIPEQDWPRLAALTTLAIARDEGGADASEARGDILVAHHELFDYFAERLAEHRGMDDDLIGYLRGMPVGNRRMRLEEVVYNCYSLLLGANVTTPHAIAASVLAFTEYPDQYRRLVDGEVDVGLAVEECLRWSSPANHFMRHVVADTDLAGVPLAAGEAVVAWLGSANRDERVFDRPYRFDLGRQPNRHVAFGFGQHYCIGAPLSRIALRVFFTELVRVVSAFELAGPIVHLRSNFTAGIRHLPVVASPLPAAAAAIDEYKGGLR